MAFRPARPLSHHTNLQLTDAAADATERNFGFESCFGTRDFNFIHPTCKRLYKAALLLKDCNKT